MTSKPFKLLILIGFVKTSHNLVLWIAISTSTMEAFTRVAKVFTTRAKKVTDMMFCILRPENHVKNH